MITLAQITAEGARPFCAGIVLLNGVVAETAPILHYMKRWSRERVHAYCYKKGWRIHVIEISEDKAP